MMRRLNQRAYVKGLVEYFTERAVSILLGHQYFPSFSHDISCITHNNSFTLTKPFFSIAHKCPWGAAHLAPESTHTGPMAYTATRAMMSSKATDALAVGCAHV